MLDETDPLIRAARAPFQQIRADLGDRFDQARAERETKLAEHDKYVAERTSREERLRAQPVATTPASPVRRRRPAQRQPDDPSETGFYSVSWMTKN